MKIEETLSFDDILLIPQYSDIESRKYIDISNKLDDSITLQIPIISSPMDSVSETQMAISMNSVGGMSIIHRYNSIEKQVEMVKDFFKVYPEGLVGIAVGAKEDYIERSIEAIKNGAKIIAIDVAHGHHLLVKKAVEKIRKNVSDNIHLMVGNVATAEGYKFLANLPVQSVRIGVGNGSICSTRLQTGHGIPLLHSILECDRIRKHNDPLIISDGGVKNSGDCVKAIAAGADFIMTGALLAGTFECPGKVIETLGGKFKQYRGMASRESQLEWKGQSSSPEGVQTKIPYRGPVIPILEDIIGGIKSGLSYSGSRNIKEFKQKVKFVRQTSAGQLESTTHILNRNNG